MQIAKGFYLSDLRCLHSDQEEFVESEAESQPLQFSCLQ